MRNKPIHMLSVWELQGEQYQLRKRIVTMRFPRFWRRMTGQRRRLEERLVRRHALVQAALRAKYDAARKEIG